MFQFRYKLQRQETTPQRPLPKLKNAGTKRSLSVDIENQWVQAKRQARTNSGPAAPLTEMREVTNTHHNMPMEGNANVSLNTSRVSEQENRCTVTPGNRASALQGHCSPASTNVGQSPRMYHQHAPLVTPQKVLGSRATPKPPTPLSPLGEPSTLTKSAPLAFPLENCVGRAMNFGSESQETSKEHNEKIMGALALMQLAGNQQKA